MFWEKAFFLFQFFSVSEYFVYHEMFEWTNEVKIYLYWKKIVNMLNMKGKEYSSKCSYFFLGFLAVVYENAADYIFDDTV